jgi:cytochrome c oxidase subunit 2
MLNWMRWLPKSVSTYGSDIDAMIGLISLLVLIWFVLTLGTFAVFLVLYRRRPGVRAAYVQGERWPEAAWILVPVAIVLGLDLWVDFRGARVWARVKSEVPAGGLTIQCSAKQFNWGFRYAGPDGSFGTEDDRVFDNELHVPVDQPVRMELQSEDVIHSFFVPSLRLKQDVVPGRTITAWFEVTTPGQYELACAELCGFGHSGMKGYLIAHSPEDFEKWAGEQWPQEDPEDV